MHYSLMYYSTNEAATFAGINPGTLAKGDWKGWMSPALAEPGRRYWSETDVLALWALRQLDLFGGDGRAAVPMVAATVRAEVWNKIHQWPRRDFLVLGGGDLVRMYRNGGEAGRVAWRWAQDGMVVRVLGLADARVRLKGLGA